MATPSGSDVRIPAPSGDPYSDFQLGFVHALRVALLLIGVEFTKLKALVYDFGGIWVHRPNMPQVGTDQAGFPATIKLTPYPSGNSGSV